MDQEREGELLGNLLYSTQISLVLFESVYRYRNYAQIAERPCLQALEYRLSRFELNGLINIDQASAK